MAQTQIVENGSRKSLFIILLVLMVIGLAASLYLTDLFVRVHDPAGVPVESFCAVSEGVNCVTVAESKYATFLGVPVSVYGAEFYLAMLFVLIYGYFSGRLPRWPSVVFDLALLSLPICLLLALVATFLIHSVCLMCCVVYAANTATFVILLALHRGKRRELLVAGPKNLWSLLKERRSFRIFAASVAAVALSQFIWIPHVVGSLTKDGNQSRGWNGLTIDGMTIGSPDAPITIEEFTDFECPWCSKSNRVILDLATRHPRDIYLVHRDAPMDMACNPHIPRPYHQHACRAAVYARCADKQGRFWPYAEMLFRNRLRLGQAAFDEFAGRLGLDKNELRQCLSDPLVIQAIQRDIDEGRTRGVTGTPTYYVNGEQITGYKSLEFWETKVAEILAGKKTGAAATNPK